MTGANETEAGTTTILKRWHYYVLVPVYILVTGIVIFCVISWKAYKIPNSSMEPTLRVGDRIFVNKANYKFGNRRPNRGEVIVFVFPEDKTKDFIKRVIGVSGDKISVKNRSVIVNGKLLEENYAILGSPLDNGSMRKYDNIAEITVPEGKYYVLGDNRDKSYDSRFWGFVDEDSIVGRARYIYYATDPSRIFTEIR